MSLNDIHSLSHTSWNCKYHIVFAPNIVEKFSIRTIEQLLEKS